MNSVPAPEGRHSLEPGSWAWLMLPALTLAAFQLRIVAGGYYLDSDDFFILRMGKAVAENPSLSHFTGFWTDEPTWRPILTAVAWLEWVLWGPEPLGRYVVTVVLHAGCAVLVGAIAGELCRSRAAGLVATTLFAAHPIHAEALAWFHSGFEGILVSAFVLGSLLAELRGRRVLALVVFQAALLTRENAMALVPLVAVVAAWRASPGHRVRSAFRGALPYAGVLGLNVALRFVLLSLAPERQGAGSFHLVEAPLTALVTTVLHPWFPVHPAIEGRAVYWFAFGTLPLVLLALWRRVDAQWVLGALLGAFVLSLPFIPAFHEADRFLNADPGGYEQRWYFFHLPVAALVLWPAAVLSRRFEGARLAMVVLPIVLLFGAMQGLNASWWRHQSDVARGMAEVLRRDVRDGARAVGLRAVEGPDAVELADQVFLNLSFLEPGGAGTQVYRRRLEGDVERRGRVVAGGMRGNRWVADGTGSGGVQWYSVDELGLHRE